MESTLAKEPLRIFLVEDSAALRVRLIRVLNAVPGFQVCGSADGVEQSIAAIGRAKPDAVILDIGLPDGNGLDVLRAIRAKGNRAHVVVLTNHALEGYRRAAFAAGVDAFLDKSGELQPLIALLSSWHLPHASATVPAT